MKKATVLLAVAVIGALILAACGGKAEGEQKQDGPVDTARNVMKYFQQQDVQHLSWLVCPTDIDLGEADPDVQFEFSGLEYHQGTTLNNHSEVSVSGKYKLVYEGKVCRDDPVTLTLVMVKDNDNWCLDLESSDLTPLGTDMGTCPR